MGEGVSAVRYAAYSQYARSYWPMLPAPMATGGVCFMRFSGALLSIIFLLAIWQAFASLTPVPPSILPAPIQVIDRFQETLSDGRLIKHAARTLSEALLGLLVGGGTALVVGYAIAKQARLEAIFAPAIIAFQATPIIAYAPLLVIWFRHGISSRVFTAALIVFFPFLMNVIVGLREARPGLRDVFRVSRATPWQTFRLLELPAAAPVLLSGLKVAATLSVVGAVVGEFVYAERGLGFLINEARYRYDTPLVFVGIISLTTMALAFYGVISLVERHFSHPTFE